jgi:voltage-gated potassium channel
MTTTASQSKRDLKHRLYDLLEVQVDNDTAKRVYDAYDIFMIVLIILNVFAVILETEPTLAAQFGTFFEVFEAVSVLIFTIDYVLRLWVCTVDPRYAQPVWGRLRFALSPLALIDLLSVLPFYLSMLLPVDLRFLRVLRLLRFLRLLKIGRYSDAVQTLWSAVRSRAEELVVCLIMGAILLVLASCAMYYVESDVHPDGFGTIPQAMWWSAVTLTTVGYGDVYPTTTLGKIIGSGIAVLGVGMFILPTGILATAFAEEVRKRHEINKPTVCPHCGKELPKS